MSNQQTPEAYIFDFGNVIINIDFDLMYNRFQEFLGPNYDIAFNALNEYEFFERVESNAYSLRDMTTIINEYGGNLTTDQVKEAWNAMLLDIPQNRLELLKQVSDQYPIYLLSNTNQVHIDEIFGRLTKQYGQNPIAQYFDQLFLSYEIGYIKPQVEIYEYLLENIDTPAENCLFFDDLQVNLDSAATLGIQTQLITKDFGIVDYFDEVGLVPKSEL